MPVAALLTRHGKGPLLAAALRPQEIGIPTSWAPFPARSSGPCPRWMWCA